MLVVDDIVDTGKTFSAVEKHIQAKTSAQLKGAVIHVKPWSTYIPRFWIEQTEKWVVYPWEFHEFLRLASEKLNSSETQSENRKKFKNAMQEVELKLTRVEQDTQR